MVKQGIPGLLLSAWLHLLQFEYWLLKQYEEYNTKNGIELNGNWQAESRSKLMQ